MIETIELAAGVTLLAVQTEKFKSGCFSFNLMRPHTKAAAPLDALLPSVLLRGSERWPDMRAISMRLDELYGATLGTLVRLRGETKLTGFYADFIEEAFLPAGEAVFAPMVEFFRDILFHPALENGLLNARYVESEKQNLIHAIESAQNDKRVYAAMRMRRIMCEGEAASIPRLGYAEDVAAITPEALTAHWRTVLRTAPIMLFYAGRRTPQEAAAKAAAPLDALLPSVLLRGSERWPDMRAISMRLDELYGATLGTLVRLRGETKLTGFYADFIEEAFLPAGEAVFAPMVEFFRDILFHPALENGLLNARYVESEKQNLIHAIESAQNDKRVYAAMRMRRIMCEGEAASIPRLGYAEDVAAITPEALTAHWRTVLRTAPIMLFYAGRRTPQEAAALFRPLFDGLERDPVSPPPTVVRRSAETVREVTESMDVTQGKLVIGMRTGITASDPGYPALVLLNSVYGSGVTSKLFVNVREKRSLCYYASSAVEKFKGLMIVSSGISFDQYETARDAILAELDACRRGEITPEELESARRSLISAVRAGLDTPAALDDWYIGMSIEPCDDPEAMLQKLPALTVEDVVRAARRITTDTIYFLKGDEA